MDHAWEHLDEVAAEHGFSGVIRIDRSGRTELERAYGMADRAHRVPNMPQTQFAIASGCKGFTALTVMSLVEAGHVRLDATARSFLGADLPEVDPRVTLEHLLAHRSGVGDYVDEDEDGEITDYVLEVPVHALATTEGYLPALAGRATKFAPGERFSYCNSGFVILALIVERVTGRTFHDVVEELVCRPAGLTDTSYLRSDELPGRAARGYLTVDGLRTNVLHLPVRGSGDGGLYSTLADLHRFWDAVGERPDRLGGDTGADAAAAQRSPHGAGPLRPRLLAARVRVGGASGRVRRRGLVPQRPRPVGEAHLDGDLQQQRRWLARGAPPHRAADPVS